MFFQTFIYIRNMLWRLSRYLNASDDGKSQNQASDHSGASAENAHVLCATQKYLLQVQRLRI